MNLNLNQRVKSISLNVVQVTALGVGLVGLALCALGASIDLKQFYHSYLFGYMYVLGFGLGSLALMMIHHLAGGGWGLILRRILESAAMTLPLMALFFIPILLTVFGDMATEQYLYKWADPSYVAGDEIIQEKAAYLNPQFFAIRAGIYFFIWIVWAVLICKFSLDQDRTNNPALAARMRWLSGSGIVLYVLTMTFASVDWVMSLNAHWFSSIYGVIFMVSQGLSTLALMIVMLALLSNREPLSEVITPKYIHDIGKLMFGFVILWAYMSFSQYIIQWSGDLAEEVPYYITRSSGGWQLVVWALMLFHFFVPFFVLLSRRLKRSVSTLVWIALFLILIRLVDLYWMIEPFFAETISGFNWLSIAAPLGIGGIWVALFLALLKRRPILSVNDPNFVVLTTLRRH